MSTTLPGDAGLAVPVDPHEEARVLTRLAFWGPLVTVLSVDVLTKAIASATLVMWHPPRPVIGDVLRVALAYNPGVAFGWHIGEYSRPVFSALATIVLLVLYQLYRRTTVGDHQRALALGLICGGAIGNLADRIRSARGVVDFIDIGIGDARWWTFNIADVGVGVGAFLLIRVLWRAEDDAESGAEIVDAEPEPAQ